MTDYQYILVERDEKVGIVTLNRPKELNALRTDLVSELATALDKVNIPPIVKDDRQRFTFLRVLSLSSCNRAYR